MGFVLCPVFHFLSGCHSTAMRTSQVSLFALDGFPLVEPGDDLAALIAAGLEHNGLVLQDGDVVVLAQKIVSKSENRYVRLSQVEVTPEAEQLAQESDKDPRIAELVLRESQQVMRVRKGAVIVRHRGGWVQAHAGIDQSNIRSDADDPRVLLLPEDPDASAAAVRTDLKRRCGVDVAVVIADSAGRPWRNGITGFAIGAAGFSALDNRIGHQDLFGRPLQVTEIGVGDELAAAAGLLMGQADEGRPVVLIRGMKLGAAAEPDVGARALLRPPHMDLFQ